MSVLIEVTEETFLLFSMLFIINYSLFKQEEKKIKTLKIFQNRLHIVNYNESSMCSFGHVVDGIYRHALNTLQKLCVLYL